MKTISKNCLNCTKEFKAPEREVKRGNGKFCCLKCACEFNGKRRPKPEPNAICALCRQEFYLNDSEKKNSKSGFYFCSRAHKDAAQRIGGIREIMPSHYGTTLKDYRDIAFRSKPKVCERCGFDTEAAITVHHKDWNHDNNAIENLEILCWNCHAIEHFTKRPSNVT